MSQKSRWNLTASQSDLNAYTELRAQENRSFVMSFLNGQMVANTSSSEQGISARAFNNGAWGFASHPQISKDGIQRVLSESQKNAHYLAKHKKGSLILPKISGAKGTIDLSSKKNTLTSQEIIDRLKEVDAYIADKYPLVKNRTVGCNQQDFIKEGINSESSNTYSHYARSYLQLRLGMDSENGPVEVKDVIGDKGQLADTFPSMDLVKTRIEKCYQHLVNKSKGIRAQAGVKEVVMDSKLAGILAHEAIGHTVEADIVLGGSIAGSAMNQTVASPLVTMIDFAHTVQGEQAPMPVLFDDEGTTAEDTLLIENGILKGFMNSKETAEHFHSQPTGHARAWGFNDEPLIRMRNTAIMPGKDKLDDMIASVEDGYYLIDHANGQADSTSEFMFSVPLGYEIKKGKLGKAILDTTISGVAFDMLKSVSMVSDEMSWVSYGTCGKKQPMTVGMGGPAIKCKISLGGQ